MVGGWTPGEGNARDLGAVVVGLLRGRPAALRRQGRVGLHGRDPEGPVVDGSRPLVIDDPPFDPPPPQGLQGPLGRRPRAVTWVRPELVIRAELGGWTRDGVVRQAAFKGIELGRDAATVVRETVVATTSAVRAAESERPRHPPRR